MMTAALGVKAMRGLATVNMAAAMHEYDILFVSPNVGPWVVWASRSVCMANSC